jgi:hypothetical protein
MIQAIFCRDLISAEIDGWVILQRLDLCRIKLLLHRKIALKNIMAAFINLQMCNYEANRQKKPLQWKRFFDSII